MSVWPISLADVRAAQERLRPHLAPSALRDYATLDAAVGAGVRVLVKHENHLPTNSFKIRNGLALVTALAPGARRRGIVAASRGNHGLGLAWAGARLGVTVTVCVPRGNNPEKNETLRGLGARLVVEGGDYDDAVEVASRLARDEGLELAHSTNDRRVLAGAGTLSLEILEEEPGVDAMVIAVGGGSQAVGALTVAREIQPQVQVFGVQARRASAIHDAWHAGAPVARESATTFADGIATRNVYEMTFEPLRAGLAGFVTVSEADLGEAVRLVLRTTHNLVEGAGAAGVAGLLALRERLAGKTVAVVLSGGNIDLDTLRRILSREL